MARRGSTHYEVEVAGTHEKVRLMKCGGRTVAVAFRFGRPFTRFVPGGKQADKIRAGRGRVRISSSQINRANNLCGGR